MQAREIRMTKPIKSVTFTSNNVKICFNRWVLSFPSSGYRILEQRPGPSLQYEHMVYFIAAPNSLNCHW